MDETPESGFVDLSPIGASRNPSEAAKDRRKAWRRRYTATSDGVTPGGRGNRKMTDDDVGEARKMLGPGFKTQREVAHHFGVSISTLRKALARKQAR